VGGCALPARPGCWRPVIICGETERRRRRLAGVIGNTRLRMRRQLAWYWRLKRETGRIGYHRFGCSSLASRGELLTVSERGCWRGASGAEEEE
jgi:hypothetical protein